MATIIKAESTLTDRYQTTIPESIRRALNLDKRDKIEYSLNGNGKVVLSRACSDEQDDPVLSCFLEFLAHDIANNPERLQSLDASFVERLNDLVGDVDVDLDAPLSMDDE
jgi:antitoxin PrlF